VVEIDPTKLVIYSDEAILVVNKPYGLLSIQDGYDKSLPYLKTILEPALGAVWMVHRLDRDTSGVMVLARSAEAHRILNHQFQFRQVEKNYQALVVGNPVWTTHRVNQPLKTDGDRRHRTIVDPQHGKPAITDLLVLEQLLGLALIQARPFSGYTHQIRAHLAFSGFPVAVDALYGSPLPVKIPSQQNHKEAPQALLSRLGLHAFSLTISHPLTLQAVTFQAPLPPDISYAIEMLRPQSRPVS
jgi:tRNA pseudouridine32 synthase / 23S rRNA pseudouridine746 synthase